jgi:hypothetical protein
VALVLPDLDAQQELVAAGSNFTIKNVLDLTKCRIFRVNQRSTRSVFPMHVLLLTQERIHVRPKTQDIKGEKKQEGPADQACSKSGPRRAGWTRQSAKMVTSTKWEK